MTVWQATFDQYWGLQGERRKVSLLFQHLPTDDEVIAEFERIGVRLNKAWFEPRYSGCITREQLAVIENHGEWT